MKTVRITILTLFCLISFSHPVGKKEKDYEFAHQGNYYSFRACFQVNAGFDCLLEIVYDIDHIRHFSAGAKSLKKIRQGENWYEITYTYQKLFFKNQSTWKRTLLKDQRKVVFEMISNKNNFNILPDIEYSSGYYLITPAKTGHRVEFFQECRLYPGLLRNSYIRQAKKRAIQFLKEFKDYIKKTCENETIQ